MHIDEEPIRSPDVYFGIAVSIDGDTAIVGASPGSETLGQGRAFVFQRTGSDWQLVQTITLPEEEYFGSSVAVQGAAQIA